MRNRRPVVWTSIVSVAVACLPASHGALTPAKVRAAIAKAGG